MVERFTLVRLDDGTEGWFKFEYRGGTLRICTKDDYSVRVLLKAIEQNPGLFPENFTMIAGDPATPWPTESDGIEAREWALGDYLHYGIYLLGGIAAGLGCYYFYDQE